MDNLTVLNPAQAEQLRTYCITQLTPLVDTPHRGMGEANMQWLSDHLQKILQHTNTRLPESDYSILLTAIADEVLGYGPIGPYLRDPTVSEVMVRAARAGIELPPSHVARLSGHARAVLEANSRLHLTSIVEPEEVLERHLGEAFEAPALIGRDVTGLFLDLGSGNGYTGLPFLAARPQMHGILAEASARKAAFLEETIVRNGFENVRVLHRQVQRPDDLGEFRPLSVIASRAMGGWAKILPRLEPTLEKSGSLLLWAGDEVERVRSHVVWRRYALTERRPLPGSEQSWIWRFERTRNAAS